MGAGDLGGEGKFAAGGPVSMARPLGSKTADRAEWLLRKGFRLPFRCRGEMNCGQKGADQHYQQVDFHVTLRRTVAASTATCKRHSCPIRSGSSNDSGVIKNG